MSVADASLLVAAFVPSDAHYPLARGWLREQLEAGSPIWIPAIALAEVGGAIRRVTGRQHEAAAVVSQIQALPGLSIEAVSVDAGVRAARLATGTALRGCDAIYVGLAEALNQPLVSLDEEQLRRASNLVVTRRP